MNTFKQFMTEAETEQKIASFDFDDTIFALQWDPQTKDYIRDEDGYPTGKLNKDIETKINDYHNQGWKVVLVTSRSEKWLQECIDFAKEHNLPIDEFYATNGNYKVSKLKRLKATVHYDDDIDELRKLKHTNVKGIRVEPESEALIRMYSNNAWT